MMYKPRYRYNWKTGKAESLYFIGSSESRLFDHDISERDVRARQIQRKRNMEISILADRMMLNERITH